MKTRRRFISISLGLALAAVSALALARFGQSLWSDEASSVWFARMPLDTLIKSLCDPHPAGYYIFLKAWLIADDSEAWLRLPSLVASLLTVVVTYQIARTWYGETGAGPAALLLALQPIQSWYASEARMYALAECFGLLAVWLGWRLIQQRDRAAVWRTGSAYVLTAVLALWIDYSALFPLGLLQLIWIAQGRPNTRRWLAAQVAVLAPVVVFSLTSNQGLTLSNDSYYPIFLAIRAANLGIELTPSTAAILLLVASATGALLCLGLAFVWRPRQLSDSPRMGMIVVGLWVAVFVFAALPPGFTLKRRIVLMLPYGALAAGFVLRRWPKAMTWVLVSAEIVASGVALFTLQREPWRNVVDQLLTANAGPSEAAWVDEVSVPAFDYYWRRAAPGNAALPWVPLFGRALPQTPDLTPAPNGTLWLITAESPYRQLVAFLPGDFRAGYELVAEQHELGIGIYRYRRRAQPSADSTSPPPPTPAAEWGLLLLSPLDTCTR